MLDAVVPPTRTCAPVLPSMAAAVVADRGAPASAVAGVVRAGLGDDLDHPTPFWLASGVDRRRRRACPSAGVADRWRAVFDGRLAVSATTSSGAVEAGPEARWSGRRPCARCSAWTGPRRWAGRARSWWPAARCTPSSTIAADQHRDAEPDDEPGPAARRGAARARSAGDAGDPFCWCARTTGQIDELGDLLTGEAEHGRQQRQRDQQRDEHRARPRPGPSRSGTGCRRPTARTAR